MFCFLIKVLLTLHRCVLSVISQFKVIYICEKPLFRLIVHNVYRPICIKLSYIMDSVCFFYCLSHQFMQNKSWAALVLFHLSGFTIVLTLNFQKGKRANSRRVFSLSSSRLIPLHHGTRTRHSDRNGCGFWGNVFHAIFPDIFK